MPDMLPVYPCSCFDPGQGWACMCEPSEKALRWFSTKPSADLMTAEQRAWCRAQLASVEGHRADECNGSDDATLARSVIFAWRDYCRDKGMLS
jgi:hypothetical protein